MLRNSRVLVVAATLLVATLGAGSVQAQYYWDTNLAAGGSGNAGGSWNTGTNWTTDSTGASPTIAWADGNAAVFSAGADGSGTLAIAVTGAVAPTTVLTEDAGTIVFSSGTINPTGAVTINGGSTLRFAGASLVANTQVINVSQNTTGTLDMQSGSVSVMRIDVGNPANVNASVTQSGGTITVVGGGGLPGMRLSHWPTAGPARTYTMSGGILNSTGTDIAIGWDGAGQMTVSGTADVNAGGVLVQRNSTLTIGGTSTVDASYMSIGDARGAGTVVQNSGAVTINGELRVGHYPNTGSYTINNGTLSVTGVGTTAESAGVITIGIDGTGTFNHAGGTVTTQGLYLDSRGATGGTDTYNLTGGTLVITSSLGIKGNATTSTFQVNLGGGTVQSNAGWSTTIPMTLTGTGGNVTFDTNGNNVALSGVLSGAGGLIKAGTGTLTLSGNNTFIGSTNVNGGTLEFNTPNFNTYTGAGININNGSTVLITQSGGAVRYDFGTTWTFDANGGGTITTGAGLNYVFSADNTYVTTGGARNNINGSSGINMNGRNIVFNVATGTDATSDLTVSLGMSNSAGSLTKMGGGRLSITGGYSSGNVNVNAGVLALGGAGDSFNPAGTTGIVVNSGGTLRLDVSNPIHNTEIITINPGGTFNLNGNTDAIAAITGGGLVTGGGGLTLDLGSTQTFTGTVTGSPGITLRGNNGGGTQVLQGTATLGGIGIQRGVGAADNNILELSGGGSTSATFVGVGQTGGAGSATLNVAGTHQLNVAGNLFIGEQNGQPGTVNQTGGTVTASGQIRVAHWPNETSAYNISAGTLNANGGLFVGWDGTGLMDVSGTADVNATAGIFVQRGSTLTIGGSSTVDASYMSIGDARGAGTVVQNNGAVTINGELRVGHYPTTGSYTINNGTLSVTGAGTTAESAGVITIGVDGTGTFNHAGGTVTTQGLYLDSRGATGGTDTYNLTGGTLVITSSLGIKGNATTSTFQVNLGGGTVQSNASWSTTIPMTLTGTGGNVNFNTNGNTVNLSGALTGVGGLVKSGAGTLQLLGVNSYAGTTTVEGGTLQLDLGGQLTGTSLVTVGNANGNGRLLITSNVSHTVGTPTTDVVLGTGGNAGTLDFQANSPVAVTLPDDLRVGETISGTASVVNHTGTGELQVNGTATIANGAGSLGQYNISAGLFNPNGAGGLVVGNLGGTAGNPALLDVTGTGLVQGSGANNLTVGLQSGSFGRVRLVDGISPAVNSFFDVFYGVDGDGQLTMNNGGAGKASVQDIHLGVNSGGHGAADIDAGTLTAGRDLVVGVASTQDNVIDQAGGDVNVVRDLVIADAAGSRGRYELSGGTVDVGGDTIVGRSGGAGDPALLNVSGGVLTTPDLIVAQNGGSEGVVNQSGGTINVTNPTTYSVGAGGGMATVNQIGGTTNVTGNMLIGNSVGPAAENNYNLNGVGAVLNFGDTLTLAPGDHHQTNGAPSTLDIRSDGQFNFNSGTLLDVSTVNANNSASGSTPAGTFHQNGPTALWEIGQQNAGPAGLTTLNGNLLQTSGTIAFDVFGFDLNNTPENTMDDMANNPIDLLIVNGDAQLGGTVDVDFIGPTPVFGDVFPLMKITGDLIIDPTFHIDGGFFRVVEDGMGNFTLQAIVPEPGTVAMWSLLALAAGGFALRRRRK